ncbi:MAG TPA: gephyrin-like molybdotransferase Glp [Candidatus Polarisedimenticolia bacterium]|nr:gephyrin-like molybdotransferase Glp [Candidatus Polarisedimenticolia bacterium]
MKKPGEPMVSVEEALRAVLDFTPILPFESVDLASALGRVLSEEIHADADQPPFDKAMMDGFALRSEDVRAAPAELQVVMEIPAGTPPPGLIAPGQAARIMTGAMIPQGSDAVQMVEKTEALDAGRVRILQGVAAGANIAPRGTQLRRGARVLSEGDRLTPARLGVLASVGRAVAQCRRLPRVVVAPTGDELVAANQVPGPGQIRNSNGPALAAEARSLGALVEELAPVPDRFEALRSCLEHGLKSNVLILSGGVSMGEYDLVEKELEWAGVEIAFRQVAIRPGKPAVFGRRGDCLVFGLPGNPVSSLVTFRVLVAPALRRMQGIASPEGVHLEARLETEVSQHPGRTGYLPGKLSFAGGAVGVRPIPTTGSADLPAHSRADALVIVPADRETLGAGDTVRVLLIADPAAIR